jgi:hypothetical protein
MSDRSNFFFFLSTNNVQLLVVPTNPIVLNLIRFKLGLGLLENTTSVSKTCQPSLHCSISSIQLIAERLLLSRHIVWKVPPTQLRFSIPFDNPSNVLGISNSTFHSVDSVVRIVFLCMMEGKSKTLVKFLIIRISFRKLKIQRFIPLGNRRIGSLRIQEVFGLQVRG